MKKLDVSMTDSQLKDLLLQKKKELFRLRFEKVSSGIKDTSALKKNRRIIAAIYTLLNSRNSEQSSGR